MNMRRTAMMVVMAIAVASMTSCASAGSTDPGCGDCVDELAQVREQIEALPDMKKLLTLKKYGASPTNGATVRAEIVSSAAGDTGIAEEVARIVWQSELAPVDVVMVTLEDSTGELVPSLPYDFRDDSRDYPTFEEQWGPRPVEE
jgi:hypothetical protein